MQSLKKILYTAMQYSLEFDLLVPPYDNVKIASVGQLETKIQYSKLLPEKGLVSSSIRTMFWDRSKKPNYLHNAFRA